MPWLGGTIIVLLWYSRECDSCLVHIGTEEHLSLFVFQGLPAAPDSALRECVCRDRNVVSRTDAQPQQQNILAAPHTASCMHFRLACVLVLHHPCPVVQQTTHAQGHTFAVPPVRLCLSVSHVLRHAHGNPSLMSAHRHSRKASSSILSSLSQAQKDCPFVFALCSSVTESRRHN